jgi:diguanylate cyclase (GGDEF)-like protein/PAS domain S-box-containing protein
MGSALLKFAFSPPMIGEKHPSDVMFPIPEDELHRAVLESLKTGVCVLDRGGRIILWNRGAQRLTGFKHYEVMGSTCRNSILKQCDLHACVTCGGDCPFDATLRNGRPREFPIELAHKHGHTVQVMMHCAPIADRLGAIVAIVQSFDQQTPVIDSERAHHHLSLHGCLDDATGIPNSGYTRLQVRESMTAFLEYHLPFAIILIQIDHLPGFRATYGYAAGDAILRVVAQTIRNTIHSGDFLGRWDEGQFLLILPNCSAHGMQVVAERLGKLVGCARLQWWGDQHSVATRISPNLVQEGDSLESLIERTISGLSAGVEQSPPQRGPEALRSAAANALKG